MDNSAIADNFDLLAKLMDINDENSFKSKTFAIAAFNIEKLPMQLKDTPRSTLFTIKGIGDSVGQKVIELLDTGKLETLSEYISKTPPGVIEMLNIKGIGPKKINTIWKQMEIESLGELLMYSVNVSSLPVSSISITFLPTLSPIPLIVKSVERGVSFNCIGSFSMLKAAMAKVFVLNEFSPLMSINLASRSKLSAIAPLSMALIYNLLKVIA